MNTATPSFASVLDAARIGSFDMAAAAYSYCARRCREAKTPRSESIWMGRREQVSSLIHGRPGVVVRRSPSGEYMVDYFRNFEPVTK